MLKRHHSNCVTIFALLPILLCWSIIANAQSLLIKGGTLIDGTGKIPIADARVLIEDGIVKKVWSGSGADSTVPTGISVVDAGGRFIIPGLIDSHVHYNWYEGELFLNYGVTSIFDLGEGRIHARRQPIFKQEDTSSMLDTPQITQTHYWTEIHPELVLEDDINQLVAAYEAIAACVLADVAEADPHCSTGGAGTAMRDPEAHFLACG